MTDDPLDGLDRLAAAAATLAGSWGARARASTTLGQERAVLRLFGVSGLDRSGRPLAGAAVDRWVAGASDGLGGGIALPFAIALLDYDLEPVQLALDVASGAVDLKLEAELLREPERRARAEAEARRLAAAALERIDADRVARRELIDLLGEARRPWLGTTLAEPDLDGALDEVATLAEAGFDVLRVEVPIGRELADRLHDAGQEVQEWRPGAGRSRDDGPVTPAGSVVGPAARYDVDESELAPTGSQRALARLRRVADGVAAERRGYVRLATAIPPLGVPEGAVVAAFERVDVVEADPVAEIVVGGVDPDRSLADHAFARRLHRRADTYLSIGPGPLVVAPDLASGQPADPATRAGRALALQALGVALARADGIADERIIVGAYPAWLIDESSGIARAVAEVAIRRRLFADLCLRFDEPSGRYPEAPALIGWPALTAAGLVHGGAHAMLMRTPSDAHARAVAEGRAIGATAAQVAGATIQGPLAGEARAHAEAAVAAALATIERLGEVGWRSVVGDEGAARAPIGGDAVAERTEAFDPLDSLGRGPG